MIRVNFAGASLVIPGSYTDVQVAQSSLASPALGVVALIGESDEGAAFSTESGLSAVTFGPDEFQAIVEKFGSGELVDAAKLAISPSNDPQIRGGAQQLLLLKTNRSLIAQLAIPAGASTYGNLKAKRAGLPGNNVSYACSIVSSKAIITLERLDSGVREVSEPLGGNTVMTLVCNDSGISAATVTIAEGQLTTTLTGATFAQPLAIDLSRFATVKQLVDFINAQPTYVATVASAAVGAKPVSILDHVAAVSIKTTAAVIKKDAQEVRDFFAASTIASFEPVMFAGLPTTKAKSYLVGGARGATFASDVTDCIDALLKYRINFVVPLFSRDAAADVADGITDAGSTYDIHAIHQAVAAHCNQASSVKGRKERQGFVAFQGSFDDTLEASASLSSARVQMLFQSVDVVSASSGLIVLKQPHMLAVLSAGMKAAAPVGLPNLYKQPLLSGFSHVDFDAETQAEKAIAGNLCFVAKAPNGGFRFVIDNSTYAQDKDAWINNRPSVIYAADVAAYSIRLATEVFVGQRNSDVSEESIKNQMVTVLDQLRSAGITVADPNLKAPAGYKDLSVKIKGSIVEIGVTLILVEGLEFILSSIRVQRAG